LGELPEAECSHLAPKVKNPVGAGSPIALNAADRLNKPAPTNNPQLTLLQDVRTTDSEKFSSTKIKVIIRGATHYPYIIFRELVNK
jgi:hypothetical protein